MTLSAADRARGGGARAGPHANASTSAMFRSGNVASALAGAAPTSGAPLHSPAAAGLRAPLSSAGPPPLLQTSTAGDGDGDAPNAMSAAHPVHRHATEPGLYGVAVWEQAHAGSGGMHKQPSASAPPIERPSRMKSLQLHESLQLGAAVAVAGKSARGTMGRHQASGAGATHPLEHHYPHVDMDAMQRCEPHALLHLCRCAMGAMGPTIHCDEHV